MEFCYKRNILSIFVEGGQKTLTHFIEEQLWDEARIFTSKEKLIKGIKSPYFDAPINEVEKLSNNSLHTYFR
jgi:diaminohydroxyphosphoribosylaminopyrimidine deaminase/5-amino-6-(5-phosphoribosylamino)uracil reductase